MKESLNADCDNICSLSVLRAGRQTCPRNTVISCRTPSPQAAGPRPGGRRSQHCRPYHVCLTTIGKRPGENLGWVEETASASFRTMQLLFLETWLNLLDLLNPDIPEWSPGLRVACSFLTASSEIWISWYKLYYGIALYLLEPKMFSSNRITTYNLQFYENREKQNLLKFQKIFPILWCVLLYAHYFTLATTTSLTAMWYDTYEMLWEVVDLQNNHRTKVHYSALQYTCVY